jgi:MATE family multidrug resistance protein
MTTGARPQYPFDVRHADVWKIALPASLAFITEPLVGIVDITVVGRLGDAGLLGGLVLGALVFDVIFSLAYFLRIGTACSMSAEPSCSPSASALS